MSKHFELFHQTGRHAAAHGERRAVASPSSPRLPELELAPATSTEIGKLVQRVFFLLNDFVPRMVVFTGFDNGGSSRRVCAHSADLLAAQVPGSVCVVDAHLRSPGMHKIFGCSNEKGLGNLMAESVTVEDAATRIRDSNLWVITSGSATGDWAQIGKLETMRACIDQLRARFDYVLIDAPILGSYPDVMSLGILADGVILVLQAHSTRREVACRVKHELEASGVQVLGAVLNDRTFPIPEAIYLRL